MTGTVRVCFLKYMLPYYCNKSKGANSEKAKQRSQSRHDRQNGYFENERKRAKNVLCHIAQTHIGKAQTTA